MPRPSLTPAQLSALSALPPVSAQPPDPIKPHVAKALAAVAKSSTARRAAKAAIRSKSSTHDDKAAAKATKQPTAEGGPTRRRRGGQAGGARRPRRLSAELRESRLSNALQALDSGLSTADSADRAGMSRWALSAMLRDPAVKAELAARTRERLDATARKLAASTERVADGLIETFDAARADDDRKTVATIGKAILGFVGIASRRANEHETGGRPVTVLGDMNVDARRLSMNGPTAEHGVNPAVLLAHDLAARGVGEIPREPVLIEAAQHGDSAAKPAQQHSGLFGSGHREGDGGGSIVPVDFEL